MKPRIEGSWSLSAEFLIANLLRVAKEDLAASRLLASAGNRNAVYLCEQAAEKIIRAVLTSEKQHAGISHQLNDMVDLIPDQNPIKSSLQSTEHLAAYATSYRYPSPTGRIKQGPDARTLEIDLRNMESALSEAARWFGVDLDKDGTPARARASATLTQASVVETPGSNSNRLSTGLSY